VAGTVYKALAGYARDAGWSLEEDADAGRLSFPMMGENGSWYVDAFAREEPSQVIVMAAFPLDVPQDRVVDAAMLVSSLNTDMVLGSFDFAAGTGEIRFRVALDTGGEPLTPPLIEPLFEATRTHMDAALPLLSRLT
jgi:hypothetical protein